MLSCALLTSFACEKGGAVLDSGGVASDSGLTAQDSGLIADSGLAGADAGSVADAGFVVDAGVVADAGVAEDAGAVADTGVLEDAGFPDDSGLADAGLAADAAPAVDAGPWDGGAGCDFLDLQVCIVQCPSGFEYLREFSDVNMTAGCAPFSMLLGNRYATTPAAIQGEGCSSQCLYKASTSVSFVDHCNHRNGYIIFRAAGCPDLYEFSNGLFPSREAWEAATHCGG